MPPNDSQGHEKRAKEAPNPLNKNKRGKRNSLPRIFFPTYEDSQSMHDDENNWSDAIARLRTSMLT